MLTPGSTEHRYFIELAFDGTSFRGWQVQPGEVTVQETLARAVSTLTGREIAVTGCGRTDSGVHASHFVAHFDVPEPVGDCVELTRRLNRFLNCPIRIDRIVEVPNDFHARFQACSRTYHYLISRQKDAFMSQFSWQFTGDLRVEEMNRACAVLIGKHDFTSFSKLHTDVKTNICEVFEASWTDYDGMLVFRIRADRFLRNMVRAIVGTLLEVGKGKIAGEDVSGIMNSLDRGEAGMSVPAKGLFLTRVDYDPEVFRIEPKSPFLQWI